MDFERPQEEGKQKNRIPEHTNPEADAAAESVELVADPTVQEVETRLEQLAKEKLLGLAIREALGFRELYTILLEAGGLQGSAKFYPAEDLIQVIGKVSQGLEDPRVLTRSGGLRSKVTNLLAQVALERRDRFTLEETNGLEKGNWVMCFDDKGKPVWDAPRQVRAFVQEDDRVVAFVDESLIQWAVVGVLKIVPAPTKTRKQ